MSANLRLAAQAPYALVFARFHGFNDAVHLKSINQQKENNIEVL